MSSNLTTSSYLAGRGSTIGGGAGRASTLDYGSSSPLGARRSILDDSFAGRTTLGGAQTGLVRRQLGPGFGFPGVMGGAMGMGMMGPMGPMRPVIYMAPLSQPCRAIWMFMCINGLENAVEWRTVDLTKGEHKTPAFLAINPNGKVPALDDCGFRLHESGAILRYLAQKFQKQDWYPAEIHEQALVNQYFEWHHLNLRKGSPLFIFNKLFAEAFGMQPNPQAQAEGVEVFKTALRFINDNILRYRNFIAGNRPTIADIQCYAEIQQLPLFEEFANLKTDYPYVNRWLLDFRSIHPPAIAYCSKLLEETCQKARGGQ